MSLPLPPALASLRIDPTRAALLLVDIQTKLAAAMPPVDLVVCQRNWLILVELARRLGLPVVWSEQYPRGLGPTLPELVDALLKPGLELHRMEKLSFSCTDSEAFLPLHETLARRQWIVVGMESHVCVWQTVRGLLGWGAEVHVPADAVISRAPANQRVGLDLSQRAGGVITSTETIAFDALGHAGTEDFRAISRLVR
jgi:nicotinamidase-related amidase